MSHSNHKQDHHHQKSHKKKGAHKDWKTWVVIGLVILMVVYVLSFDFSNPQDIGGPSENQGEMPAAAE